jgi:hypothetical protein
MKAPSKVDPHFCGEARNEHDMVLVAGFFPVC